LKRRFGPDPVSVATAREAVRAALADSPNQVVEDTVLIVSELASNCVRHARTEYELRLDTDGDVCVGELRDQTAGEPKIRSSALSRPFGHGLRIVEALSDSWGVTHERDGKVVWFRLGSERSSPGTTR
jgi:anti-sigma regulatory factor (Ser/Thr protein kinase)